MIYVIDTNAASELMRGAPRVLERLASTPRTSVRVPQPVLSELRYGVARLRRSKRRNHLADRLSWIEAEMFRSEWTDDVSHHFAQVKAALERRGDLIEDFDIAIAAHALAESAVLVTSNQRHMARIPDLVLEDWARPDPPD